MNPTSDLVNKLWRLCAVLRKDGITYPQYVTELTYPLFLKMLAERKLEEGKLPDGALARHRRGRWRDQGRKRRSRLACGQKMMTDSRHSEQSFRACPLFEENVDQSQLGSTSMSRCTIADQLARDYFLAFASPAACI
ncbi:hypothetical protein [Methylosinus sp. Sm6]|uniref:hypothetical protein n=1 Tax=Methylosinus sp. Sm6 TaxID=2866948 RepID=UPI001C9A1DF9|nr:hypothetical protein [Methylosinus sp. Sm6]MBY6240445.1 hypothetical protein [Methylosinus sp. Sm6]